MLLVSVGILLALQINNWNNNIQQKELHLQLIDLLISDLEESRDEHLSDLKFNEITLNMLNHTIDYYKQNQKIDTLNLKNILNLLGTDIFFKMNRPLFMKDYLVLTCGPICLLVLPKKLEIYIE